jgi:hypothetical protein
VTAGGAIRSGKTKGAGRLFFETAITHPSTYLASRLTYRELEDSTKKAMPRGDGDVPPLIPREAIREERAGDNLVHLHEMRHERQREAVLEPARGPRNGREHHSRSCGRNGDHSPFA